MLISIEETGKNQLEPGYKGCSNFVTLFFAKKSLTKPTGVLEHCRDGVTKSWFSIFLAIPSDRIRKALNDDNINFFIHSSNSYKLFQRIPGRF
jgi:hypothetical protein